MSESTPAPDWNLLPHSPQAFFCLEEGFGRKDLKRSYNRLIRIYKPEKFPQEFQRIRGAFEQLDNQLRYGTQFLHEENTGTAYEWVTDAPLDESSEQEGSLPLTDALESQASHKLPLHVRVQQEPLVEIYRQLSNKTKKSAYDYYALAVMSDIVHRKDGLQFARWIFAGITSLPDDHGLSALLYAYLRSPIPVEALPKLLFACSSVIESDRFYAMTESLWLRILRETSFPVFCSTLEKCEKQLQGVGIDGRLAFLIEILKTAIWVADREWLDKAMALIDENFERIPFHIEYDVDLLAMLKNYIDSRSMTNQSHPLRQKIQHAIQTYFSEGQQSGDLCVLDAQIAIAQDPTALTEAFPFADGEDLEPLFMVWSTISEDVAERNVPPKQGDEDLSKWQGRVQALLQRLNAVTKSSLEGTRWFIAGGCFAGGLFALYSFAILAFSLLLTMLTFNIGPGSTIVFGIVAVSCVAGFLSARWIHKKFITPTWERYDHNKSTKCYRNIWRQEFIDFLDRSHLSYFELRDHLFQCNIYGLPYSQTCIDQFQQDYALAFYSTARRFVV